MKISIIAAVSVNNAIGLNGKLPWHLHADMARFRELTTGHAVIMGRRTWESIEERFRPLKKRLNIVVSSTLESIEGAHIAKSLPLACEIAAGYGWPDEVFVMGGGRLYKEAIPLAQRVHLTVVKAEVAGDTFFPVFDRKDWNLAKPPTHHPADEENEYPMTFETWERRGAT